MTHCRMSHVACCKVSTKRTIHHHHLLASIDHQEGNSIAFPRTQKRVGSSSTAMLCAPKRDYHGRIHHVVKACYSYSGYPIMPHKLPRCIVQFGRPISSPKRALAISFRSDNVVCRSQHASEKHRDAERYRVSDGNGCIQARMRESYGQFVAAASYSRWECRNKKCEAYPARLRSPMQAVRKRPTGPKTTRKNVWIKVSLG
jgi:hypothetical protein